MPMYSLYEMPMNTPQLAASPLLGRDEWCRDGLARAGTPSVPDARGLETARRAVAAPKMTSYSAALPGSDETKAVLDGLQALRGTLATTHADWKHLPRQSYSSGQQGEVTLPTETV